MQRVYDYENIRWVAYCCSYICKVGILDLAYEEVNGRASLHLRIPLSARRSG